MSRITIKEIREKYLAGKAEERKFKWTYYVRRPISYYLTWPCLRLNISATTVTLIWLVVAAIGSAFMIQGGYFNMIVGALLLEFAVILDCVDGHIARFTRKTKTGEILDMWVGQILLVSSLFSIGIGLARTEETLFATNTVTSLLPFITIEKTTFVYLGFLTALAALSSWTVRLHWRTKALQLGIDEGEPDEEVRSSKKAIILDNLFHYSGAITMLMVVAAALFLLDALLVLLAIVYTVYLLSVMAQIIRKARSIDNMAKKVPEKR
jgi:hypothetical protein